MMPPMIYLRSGRSQSYIWSKNPRWEKFWNIVVGVVLVGCIISVLILAFLVWTEPVGAQTPQQPRPDARWEPLSGSSVTIPAGVKYLSGNPLKVTLCTPKAPATTCIVKGTVWVRKQGVAQSFAVDGKTRSVEGMHPEFPACSPGYIHPRRGDAACMIDPSKAIVPNNGVR